MTENYHSPIVAGQNNGAETWNVPFGALDAAILGTRALIDNLVINSGTSDAETIAARLAGNNDASTPTTLSHAIEFASGGIFNVMAYGATGDGVANDTTAIAAALTAANGVGGGIVKLPQGSYRVTTLTIPANVTLEGQGASSIIEITTTSGSGIVMSTRSRILNAKILYEGQTTGTHRALIYSEADDVLISGLLVECTFEADASTENLVSAIKMSSGPQNFIISNCVLKGPGHATPFYSVADTMGWGIHIQELSLDASSGHISDVTSSGWTDGIKVSCPDIDLVITNCILCNNGNDGIDAFYSVGGNIVVNGCIFRNNMDHVADFKVIGTGVPDGDSYAVNFTNNICHDHTDAAGGSGSVGFSGNTRLLIANNQFYNMTKCLNLNLGTSGQVIGNRIQNIAQYGISVSDVEDNDAPLLIANNMLIDCGTTQSVSNRDGGIKLDNTTNVTISGNIIYWTAGTISSWSNVFAILIDAGTVLECVMTGNYTNRQGVIFGGGSAWTDNFIYGNVNIHTQSEGTLRWNNTTHFLQGYTGTAWESMAYQTVDNSFSTRQTFTKGVRSGTVSINDDDEAQLTGLPTRGIFCLFTGSQSGESLMANYRAESTPHILKMAGGGATAVVATALAGTTGSDGFITLGCDAAGVIYIENRTGGAKTVQYFVIG